MYELRSAARPPGARGLKRDSRMSEQPNSAATNTRPGERSSYPFPSFAHSMPSQPCPTVDDELGQGVYKASVQSSVRLLPAVYIVPLDGCTCEFQAVAVRAAAGCRRESMMICMAATRLRARNLPERWLMAARDASSSNTRRIRQRTVRHVQHDRKLCWLAGL